jgi:hypothetical protein
LTRFFVNSKKTKIIFIFKTNSTILNTSNRLFCDKSRTKIIWTCCPRRSSWNRLNSRNISSNRFYTWRCTSWNLKWFFFFLTRKRCVNIFFLKTKFICYIFNTFGYPFTNTFFRNTKELLNSFRFFTALFIRTNTSSNRFSNNINLFCNWVFTLFKRRILFNKFFFFFSYF